jgi:hypothetical protein
MRSRAWVHVVILLAIVALGAVLRLYGLDESRTRSHDQCFYLNGGRTYYTALRILPEVLEAIDQPGRISFKGRSTYPIQVRTAAKPLFVPQIGLMMFIFGPRSGWASLSLAVGFGLIGIALVYFFSRNVLRLGEDTALWSALLLATSSLHIHYSRYGGPFTQAAVFALGALGWHLRSVQGNEGQRNDLAAVACGMFWMIAIMMHYSLIVVFAPFLVGDLAYSLLRDRKKLGSHIVRLWLIASSALVPLVVVELGRAVIRDILGVDLPSYLDELLRQIRMSLAYTRTFGLPVTYLLSQLVSSEGWLLMLFALLGLMALGRCASNRHDRFLLCSFPILFLAAHSLPAYKNAKTVVPLLPILCGLGATGLCTFLRGAASYVTNWNLPIKWMASIGLWHVVAVALVIGISAAGVADRVPPPGSAYDQAMEYVQHLEPSPRIATTWKDAPVIRFLATDKNVFVVGSSQEIEECCGYVISTLTTTRMCDAERLNAATTDRVDPNLEAIWSFEQSNTPIESFQVLDRTGLPVGKEVRIYRVHSKLEGQ